jgi:GNAT superfamily N-acetyltransferase
MNVRGLDWPNDRDSILALDTSYVADRRLCLDMTARCAALVEEVLPVPVSRTYGLGDIVDKLPEYAWVRVASDGPEVVGLAALSFEAWNRRVRLEHLYVTKRVRGRGVGRTLIEAALQAAASLGARGVFVETQTTNYGAVRFYEQTGFRWCGLDSSLYDRETVADGEVGIFFWRDVPESACSPCDAEQIVEPEPPPASFSSK